MAIEFAGELHNNAGAKIQGADVALFVRDTADESTNDSSAEATTTTDSSGQWSFSEPTQNRYDVRITSASSVRWRLYDDAIQMEELELKTLAVRGGNNSYKVDITIGNIAADATLAIPVIGTSDTLAVLGLAQTFSAAQTFTSTVTVGVNDAGHDVTFFGNTASAYMLWDTSADDLVLAGAAGIDLAGDIDVDGTANLDAVDIDGAVQIDATFTSGVDGQGYDTKFFGDTASAYILWDTSADKLLTAGGAVIDIVKDKLLIGGTAVTTTAAELNILDTATVTATELNLIDGGTARGTTAVASGDGILINDAGTMRMTNVDTVSTYFAGHSVGGGNIVTTGALNSGSITSGFGTIDIGSSALSTTGTITGPSGTWDSGGMDIAATDSYAIDGTNVLVAATLGSGVTASSLTSLGTQAEDLAMGANNVVFSSGSGINFSATSDATVMTSELFDDYEEGTFTPELGDSSKDGSGESQAYSGRVGRYTKIGNRCYFQLYLALTDLGDLVLTQTCYVVGLPFTTKNATDAYSAISVGYGAGLALPAAQDSIGGYTIVNEANFQLRLWDATGGQTAMKISEFSDTGGIMVNGHYEVN